MKRRGSVQSKEAELIAVWVPIELAAHLDKAVKIEDTDRSKFLRNAVRERLMRLGVAKEAKEAEVKP